MAGDLGHQLDMYLMTKEVLRHIADDSGGRIINISSVKRFLEADEIAELVCYIASDRAKGITVRRSTFAAAKPRFDKRADGLASGCTRAFLHLFSSRLETETNLKQFCLS